MAPRPSVQLLFRSVVLHTCPAADPQFPASRRCPVARRPLRQFCRRRPPLPPEDPPAALAAAARGRRRVPQAAREARTAQDVIQNAAGEAARRVARLRRDPPRRLQATVRGRQAAGLRRRVRKPARQLRCIPTLTRRVSVGISPKMHGISVSTAGPTAPMLTRGRRSGESPA